MKILHSRVATRRCNSRDDSLTFCEAPPRIARSSLTERFFSDVVGLWQCNERPFTPPSLRLLLRRLSHAYSATKAAQIVRLHYKIVQSFFLCSSFRSLRPNFNCTDFFLITLRVSPNSLCFNKATTLFR